MLYAAVIYCYLLLIIHNTITSFIIHHLLPKIITNKRIFIITTLNKDIQHAENVVFDDDKNNSQDGNDSPSNNNDDGNSASQGIGQGQSTIQ